jgi:hypothetical protein
MIFCRNINICVSVVRALIAAGSDVYCCDEVGDNCLFFFYRWRNIETRVDTAEVARDLSTALYNYDSAYFAALLIAASADVN